MLLETGMPSFNTIISRPNANHVFNSKWSSYSCNGTAQAAPAIIVIIITVCLSIITVCLCVFSLFLAFHVWALLPEIKLWLIDWLIDRSLPSVYVCVLKIFRKNLNQIFWADRTRTYESQLEGLYTLWRCKSAPPYYVVGADWAYHLVPWCINVSSEFSGRDNFKRQSSFISRFSTLMRDIDMDIGILSVCLSRSDIVSKRLYVTLFTSW